MPSADSPGPSTSRPEPVLIFDLDGTILSVNSFPKWVMYLLRGSFPALNPFARLVLSLRVAALLAGRKILKHPHGPMKRQMQRLWQRATAADGARTSLDHLTAQLLATVRPNMHGLLEALRAQPVDAVLATAAAGEYGHYLGEKLGFFHILTTPEAEAVDYAEHSRETKRTRTFAYLAAQGWQERPRVFFTDHEEDLPLIRASQRVLWFGPESKLPMVRREAPGIEIVPALGLDAQSLLAATRI